jgi:hypothetical protein
VHGKEREGPYTCLGCFVDENECVVLWKIKL